MATVKVFGKQVDFPYAEENISDIDDATLQQVGEQIYHALKTDGFVILRKTGIPMSKQYDALWKITDTFMALPSDVKESVSPDPNVKNVTGYISRESLEHLDSDDLPEPDIKEVINFNLHDGRTYSMVPGMHSTYSDMYRKCLHISETIMAAIALSLGKEKDFFNKLISHGQQDASHNMRIALYPPMHGKKPAPNQKRCGAHIDFGILTIITQEKNIGGLEVLTKDGWVEPKVDEDSVILFAGEVLQIWLKDDIKAIKHKVEVPTDGREDLQRRSTIFFLMSKDMAPMAPIDGSARTCPYPTFVEYAAAKFARMSKKNPIGSVY